MKISRMIKDNRFIRSVFYVWRRNFAGLNRNKFGHIADNVILIPPCQEI